MASAIKPISFFSLAIALLISSFNAISDPEPSPWPHQFHSLIFINNTGGVLQAVDLWYDCPNARNLNVVQNQLGKRHYEIEWGNGTSFYYTLDSDRQCEVREYPVGILRLNWLENATYLGRKTVDGFVCNVWEKVQFIWYYEDVVTKRPVYWIFFTGMIAHVMTFEVGAVLEDEHWQAPAYCFEGKNEDQIGSVVDDVGSSLGLKMMNSF